MPPLKDIQHAIYLVSGSQMPNIPYYRMNHVERAELNRQLEGLLEKSFIHHSHNPSVVYIMLTPKKDRS